MKACVSLTAVYTHEASLGAVITNLDQKKVWTAVIVLFHFFFLSPTFPSIIYDTRSD